MTRKEEVKVSVIIPVYNTPEKYLKPCLDSVMGQSLEEIEIIIVDNCSTDDTFVRLEGYAKADSRIVLIRQAVNGGVANSRNTGASHATGCYLYFMDSDDTLEKTALFTLYHRASQEEVEVLLFAWDVVHEEDPQGLLNPHVVASYPPSCLCTQSGQEVFSQLIQSGWEVGFIWIQLIKRDSFQARGLKFHCHASTCDDVLFFFQNLHTAQKVLCISDVLYHYTIRQQSHTNLTKGIDYAQGAFTWYLEALLSLVEYGVRKERPEIYERYFRNVRNFVAYHQAVAQKNLESKGKETLLNLQHFLWGEPLETLPTSTFSPKAEDEFCFFGAGIEGKRVLSLFGEMGFPFPVAICDNNPKIQGTKMGEIPVLSLEKALDTFPKAQFIITNQRFYQEIYEQLNEKVESFQILNLGLYE